MRRFGEKFLFRLCIGNGMRRGCLRCFSVRRRPVPFHVIEHLHLPSAAARGRPVREQAALSLPAAALLAGPDVRAPDPLKEAIPEQELGRVVRSAARAGDGPATAGARREGA